MQFYSDMERNWSSKSMSQSTLNSRLEFIDHLLGFLKTSWTWDFKKYPRGNLFASGKKETGSNGG